MNVHLVVHGKSAGRPELRAAVAATREQGHRVTVRPTWEAGDSALLAQRAVGDGADAVVAGGGDGTVNEVAMGLVTAAVGSVGRPSFGILPLGTANDFARSAGIPLDLTAALDLIVTRPATSVDVGRIGDRIFLNVATGGFGTQVTVETPENLKKSLGGAAYLLTGLTRFSSIRAARAVIRGPDFAWEGRFLVLAVGNGRQAGGGHVLCKNAVITDGLLEVSVLPEVGERQLGQFVKQLMLDGVEAIENAIVTARVANLDIEADEEIFINLDGEPISGRRFHATAMPGALAMHLPESSPLL